ncbi:MAG: FtsQ-type POTRA domain-containing protein [Clostridia bacterium]|nr:FtsQ-type POTRA domain-containing protein [Clostridia bacterium]
MKGKGKVLREEKAGPSPILLWILILILIAGLFFLMTSSLFNVTEITVYGCQAISEEEVIRLSGITEETNIVKLSEREAREQIESNPHLEVTDIKRVFPTGVEIYVRERVAAGQINTANGCFLIDADGIALEVRAVPDETLPQILNLPISQPVGGKTVPTAEADRLDAAVCVMKAIRACRLTGKITSIDVEDPYRLVLCYDGYLTVLLAGGATAEEKLMHLEDTIAAIGDKLTEGKVLHLESEGGYYLK